MSTRLRLTNDPYVRALEKRSKLALDWFNAIATALWDDLEEFREQEANRSDRSYALQTLELGLSGDLPVPDRDAEQKCRAELLLSTRCSKVRVVANDPTGWIYLEVSKTSPIFNGVLHRGAIEVVLLPQGSGRDEIHLVECDWLNLDGSESPKTGEDIASLLWSILFLPKIRHQLAAAQRGSGH